MYVTRTAEKIVEKTSASFPVVMITGPRQVGKTSLLEQCSAKLSSKRNTRKYISLDNMRERVLAQNEPELFLERYAPPVFIDEIQYAPGLLPYIKQIVDTKKKNGLFWITGSQQFSLMQHVTESLAGRVGIIKLLGISNSELAGLSESQPFFPTEKILQQKEIAYKNIRRTNVFEKIWRGSFPRLIFSRGVDWSQFYESYITTYVERDIRAITQVSDELKFLRFIRVCAARTGQLLNYADLAKETDVSLPTAKSWLSLLSTSGLVYLLEPYFTNIEKRIVKTPKLYFLDTGLAAYLTGWETAKTLEIGATRGAFFETYVVSEILKSYYNNGKSPRMYFYRDHDKKEIDLLLEKNATLYPFEIKTTANPNASDLKNFSVLETKKIQHGSGGVICLAKTHSPITKDAIAIPVDYI